MRTRSERGASSVEFALAFPILFLLTIGFIDFSRAIWGYNTLAYAAREGVRYAAVRGSKNPEPATEETIAEVVKDSAIGIAPSALEVSAVWTPNNDPGSVVQVTATHEFVFMTPGIGKKTITMNTSSRMVIAY
jgi:Flp pilus assembly protein TadG